MIKISILSLCPASYQHFRCKQPFFLQKRIIEINTQPCSKILGNIFF